MLQPRFAWRSEAYHHACRSLSTCSSSTTLSAMASTGVAGRSSSSSVPCRLEHADVSCLTLGCAAEDQQRPCCYPTTSCRKYCACCNRKFVPNNMLLAPARRSALHSGGGSSRARCRGLRRRRRCQRSRQRACATSSRTSALPLSRSDRSFLVPSVMSKQGLLAVLVLWRCPLLIVCFLVTAGYQVSA